MSINNVRAIGDDRPWKDEVEREVNKLWDAIRYGKVAIRSVTSGGGGSGGAGPDVISAELPATYDNVSYIIGVNEDAFDHISNLDFAQFDTTSTATGGVGIMKWNDLDGTLEFGLKGGNVTLQIGQEQVMRVRNNTGSDLLNGTVVYITGADGTNFNVAKALANADATSAQTLGVLTEDITTSAQHGYVTTNGLVRNIDLSYISGLTAGDILYLDGTTAGRMTRIKPQAPTHMVYVGYCLSAAGGGVNSTIFVKPQNGYELDELHDVKITGPIANNEVLAYTSATSLWENKTASEAGLIASGTTAGGDLTGTYPNPTIKASVNLTNPTILRDNSTSEGGQLNFARASDNAVYWYMDAYGSTSTPDLRFIAGTNNYFQFNATGSFAVNGQTGTSGQVLTSAGAGSSPTWTTISGTGTVTSVATGTGLTGGPITTTGTVSLANTAVTIGSYGSASAVGTFTVDQQGRLTAAGSTSIAIAASQITSGTLSVARGGTGASTLTSGGYLKGNGTSAITSQTGIPASDITSGTLAIANGGTAASTIVTARANLDAAGVFAQTTTPLDADSNVGDIWIDTSSTVPDGQMLPTGAINIWSTTTAPAGWLVCDGTAISRTTYSTLFTVIGTTYGTGDGSTTFNLPNLTGRIPVGKNAGTFTTLGATGGAENVTLTAQQSGGWYGSSNEAAGYGLSVTSFFTNRVAVTTTPQAHTNLQPYIVMNYIIKL